jgi:phosphatidylglycerol:prolipoprotein diacylglycerol transferase
MRGCCWGDVCGNTALLRHQLAPAVLTRVQTVAWVCGSNWPLQVTFPRGTPAYTDQMLLGLMPQPALRSLPCHPVQLYEAALVAVLALVLLWHYPRRRFPWAIASIGLGGYALLRFFMEFLRADHTPVFGGLTLVQLIAAPCALTAVIWWLAARRGRRRAGPARPTSPAWQR